MTAKLGVLRALYKADREGLREALGAAEAAERYLKFAFKNQLAGTSYFLLEECGEGSLAPEWKWFQVEQWGRNQRLQREARKVHACLRGAGIEHAFFKGIFFSRQYYGSPDARSASDLDVLVEKVNLARVDQALRAEGFERKSRTLWTEAATVRFNHGFDYERGGLKLDLHWTLADHPTFRIDAERLWRDRQTVEIGRDIFPVVGLECALTALVLGAFRDVELGTCTLRPFADLFRMVENLDGDFDWAGFLERARRQSTFRISINILNMTMELFEGRDRATHLAAQIERHRDVLRCHSAAEAMGLIESRGKRSLKNRLWCWRLYDASFAASLYWWTVSLPFRVAASSGRRAV